MEIKSNGTSRTVLHGCGYSITLPTLNFLRIDAKLVNATAITVQFLSKAAKRCIVNLHKVQHWYKISATASCSLYDQYVNILW